MKKDFISITDLNRDEIEELIIEAHRLKVELKEGRRKRKDLEGKLFALIFEKPSLRTRVTFEAAIYQLGADPIYLAPGDIKLGVRESVRDVARNLEKWVDGIIARVFDHAVLEEMSSSSIPVINALSDLEHPCQALADFMTIWEKRGTFRVNLTFVGDGNNVAHSLLLLTSIFGGNFTIACPSGYEPKERILKRGEEIAAKTGATIKVVQDPREAVKTADFIYTDVWASMGQESEAEERKRVFTPYQVNNELLKIAPKDALVMHCLPAHRGEEITDEVLDGERSIVLDQAENRLHTEKALLLKIFK
jgi:ornithine carbamoyltransferase